MSALTQRKRNLVSGRTTSPTRAWRKSSTVLKDGVISTVQRTAATVNNGVERLAHAVRTSRSSGRAERSSHRQRRHSDAAGAPAAHEPRPGHVRIAGPGVLECFTQDGVSSLTTWRRSQHMARHSSNTSHISFCEQHASDVLLSKSVREHNWSLSKAPTKDEYGKAQASVEESSSWWALARALIRCWSVSPGALDASFRSRT